MGSTMGYPARRWEQTVSTPAAALTDRNSLVSDLMINDTELSLGAVILDSVMYASEVLPTGGIMCQVIADMWKIITQCDASPYPELCRLHAYIEIMYGGLSDRQEFGEQRRASVLQLLLRGKRIFLTQRGLIGTAYTVRKGGWCSITFGCKTLSILHKAEHVENSYRLLGPAYVTGTILQVDKQQFSWLAMLGREESKDWTRWDVDEEVIHLC
ncbi:hypothetical protein F5Y19DRAFT_487989 [Xylariaceae sp. FL1651]|nr:hypothetical protein F5Y19DRAFT_487989 [Xylariaceae sp. FL1651]